MNSFLHILIPISVKCNPCFIPLSRQRLFIFNWFQVRMVTRHFAIKPFFLYHNGLILMTYWWKSSLLIGLSEPLAITLIMSSVSTKGTRSLFIPNFFFLWSKKCPKSMWNNWNIKAECLKMKQYLYDLNINTVIYWHASAGLVEPSAFIAHLHYSYTFGQVYLSNYILLMQYYYIPRLPLPLYTTCTLLLAWPPDMPCYLQFTTYLALLCDHDVWGVSVTYTQDKGGHTVTSTRVGEGINGCIISDKGTKES